MKPSLSEETLARMMQWRHALHAMPEIAYQEHKTADFVAARLSEMGLRVERGLACTGVIGILQGRGTSNRMIALRAELDALPITEDNPTLNYASRHNGRMHACGHDGHMAMLLGAADHLAHTRNFAGTVAFVFQPAEENENGARRMIPHSQASASLLRPNPSRRTTKEPSCSLAKVAIRTTVMNQKRNALLGEGCYSDDRDDPRYHQATYPWNGYKPWQSQK